MITDTPRSSEVPNGVSHAPCCPPSDGGKVVGVVGKVSGALIDEMPGDKLPHGSLVFYEEGSSA